MAEFNRIITHYDFDGVVSAMLLAEQFGIDSSEVIFTHPNESKLTNVVADAKTIICDLPYFPNAGAWFDHHGANFRADIIVPGKREIEKSCGRVIARNFGLEDRFADLLIETDKVDSANLEMTDVLDPQDYILVSYVVGANYTDPKDVAFNRHLLNLLPNTGATGIVNDPVVRSRIKDYLTYMEVAKEMVKEQTSLVGGVAVMDLRVAEHEVRPEAIRYLHYALNPEANFGVTIFHPADNPEEVNFGVGYNPFSKGEVTVDIGSLMRSLGGGGHAAVGGTRVSNANFKKTYNQVMTSLTE
ncbi:hypothetical protein HOC13_04070 [Candidatus Woesearchaeota archaeon]|jgi:hypothetical protein|nr:hypothetical protein [Candidatus Woesearchaeota archaeon]